MSTFQFLAPVLVELFKVFPLDRVLLLRFVEQPLVPGAVFSPDRVHQRSVVLNAMMMPRSVVLNVTTMSVPWRSVMTTGSPWLMTGASTSGAVVYNTTHWRMSPGMLHRWVRLKWETSLDVETQVEGQFLPGLDGG